MATFSLIFFLYAFQKQVLSIPKVYFINKLLMDSKYTLKQTSTNYFLNYFPIIFKEFRIL